MRRSRHRAANGLVDKPGEGGERPARGLGAMPVLGEVVQQHSLRHAGSHCRMAHVYANLKGGKCRVDKHVNSDSCTVLGLRGQYPRPLISTPLAELVQCSFRASNGPHNQQGPLSDQVFTLSQHTLGCTCDSARLLIHLDGKGRGGFGAPPLLWVGRRQDAALRGGWRCA